MNAQPPAPPPPPPPPPPEAPPPAAGAPVPKGPYPIGLEIDYKRQPGRWTTFFRLIVVIPWLFVGAAYGIVGLVATLLAWFALLVTGRYPQVFYNWNAGILRFSGRLQAYVLLATDEWPPFGWAENPEYPVRVPIAPRAEKQSRLKVFFRFILIIPALFVAWGIGYVSQGAAIASWIVIVFRGYVPQGLVDAQAFAVKWNIRLNAYAGLMTDIYPPVGDEAPALSG